MLTANVLSKLQTKILKNIGFSEPDHRYEWPPKAVGQAVKSRRMQNAEAEYEQARVYAEAYGISLKRFSDIHYQIHDLSKDVVINLYPSNQRIYADKKHLVAEIDEPFIYTWKGKRREFMSPPDRPNDRSILVPYREAWGKNK